MEYLQVEISVKPNQKLKVYHSERMQVFTDISDWEINPKVLVSADSVNKLVSKLKEAELKIEILDETLGSNRAAYLKDVTTLRAHIETLRAVATAAGIKNFPINEDALLLRLRAALDANQIFFFHPVDSFADPTMRETMKSFFAIAHRRLIEELESLRKLLSSLGFTSDELSPESLSPTDFLIARIGVLLKTSKISEILNCFTEISDSAEDSISRWLSLRRTRERSSASVQAAPPVVTPDLTLISSTHLSFKSPDSVSLVRKSSPSLDLSRAIHSTLPPFLPQSTSQTSQPLKSPSPAFKLKMQKFPVHTFDSPVQAFPAPAYAPAAASAAVEDASDAKHAPIDPPPKAALKEARKAAPKAAPKAAAKATAKAAAKTVAPAAVQQTPAAAPPKAKPKTSPSPNFPAAGDVLAEASPVSPAAVSVKAVPSSVVSGQTASVPENQTQPVPSREEEAAPWTSPEAGFRAVTPRKPETTFAELPVLPVAAAAIASDHLASPVISITRQSWVAENFHESERVGGYSVSDEREEDDEDKADGSAPVDESMGPEGRGVERWEMKQTETIAVAAIGGRAKKEEEEKRRRPRLGVVKTALVEIGERKGELAVEVERGSGGFDLRQFAVETVDSNFGGGERETKEFRTTGSWYFWASDEGERRRAEQKVNGDLIVVGERRLRTGSRRLRRVRGGRAKMEKVEFRRSVSPLLTVISKCKTPEEMRRRLK